jgi:hypothetical protein
VTWRRDDLIGSYPVATYSLSYTFRCVSNSSAATFSITASEDSEGYYAQVTSTQTGAIATANLGTWAWQAYITRTSDSVRTTVGEGLLEIVSDFATQNIDNRTHAQTMLDKIESILENRADSDVSNYAIQGRSITKLTPGELTEWKDYYGRIVLRQRRARDRKLGRPVTTTIAVKF